MINWVGKKNINADYINMKIQDCVKTKHFTNNGKNVIASQKYIKNLFEIEEDKEVLLTCNGAMGLHSLIGGFNIFFNKKLRWIVPSFTFPCSKQGSLIDSIVVDIDENMGPNMNDLYSKIDDYDGIVITNCFGTTVNIQLYESFCKENNKLLIFDNAASSFSYYDNKNILNYGDACMVSLHHTKPIGFGEGGFIIFKQKFLESMEKSICFGYSKIDRHNYNEYANNSKMSEIACIYITDYLSNVNNIFKHHTMLISYFIDQYHKKKLEKKATLFKNYSDYTQCLMATVPLIFSKPVDISIFTKHNIEAKKYYFPLSKDCPISVNLFDHIICLPLNLEMDLKEIDLYIDIIESFE
jgi:dTDP-4-amino-4,6-dideoxygalactose transaminase